MATRQWEIEAIGPGLTAFQHKKRSRCMKGSAWLAVLVLALMFIGCWGIGSALGRAGLSGIPRKAKHDHKAAAGVDDLQGGVGGGGAGVVASGTSKRVGVLPP